MSNPHGSFMGVLVGAVTVSSVFAGASASFDSAAGWRPHADGGRAPRVEAVRTPAGKPALRLRYRDAPPHWGNIRHDLRMLPEATGLAFRFRVNSAASGAAFHVWLFEKDGDGYLARVRPGGRELEDAVGAWYDVVLPFTQFKFEPRGDRQRRFMTVDSMLLGCNFGDLDVTVAGLHLVSDAVRAVPLPRSAGLAPVRGARGSVAILAEPLFEKRVSHPDPHRLGRLLTDRGFGVTYLRAGDAANAAVLTPANFAVLVVPCAPFYPAAGKSALQQYLRQGGAFFSIGGYAFDELLTRTDRGWSRYGPTVTAAEMDRGVKVRPLVNTRFGTPGDTLGLRPEQIGVFDPAYELLRVAGVRAAPVQHLLPSSWGRKTLRPAGFAAVAMTGSNSPVFPRVYGRSIPVLQAVDRFGRSRGPVLTLVHNYAGPYSRAGWAFTGVTDQDLFDGRFPALDRLFVDLIERLCRPVFLRELRTDLACYRPGETVHLSVRLTAAKEGRSDLRLRFTVDGVSAGECEAPVDEEGPAVVSWTVPAQGTDFCRVRCVLIEGDRTLDELQTGFTVWTEDTVRAGPRIRFRDNYFLFNGMPTFLCGTNQTGMMWFSANENPLVWERDFRRMRDYGLDMLRILHFSPFAREERPDKGPFGALELKRTPPKITRRKTDAIVQTAQKHNVGVFLVLHDWLPVALTDAELAAERDWARFWAGRYRRVPGIFYDIQNEPSVRTPNRPDLRKLFQAWLEARYGSLDAAFVHWRASGGPATLDLGTSGRADWADLRSRDLDLFRVFLFNRWAGANAAGVREGAPGVPVTVGFLQNLTAAEKLLGSKELDFVNTHYYGGLDRFRGVLKLIDRRWQGKSFSLGEFGARQAHDARTHGKIGDPAEASVNWFLAVGHYALGMGASFIANWDWKDFTDCVFPWGVNFSDLTPKPVLEAYRNMSLLFRSIRPRYVPPSFFLLVPDGTRFGAHSKEVNAAMVRSINWLLDANAPFGVINEWDLSGLPASARALVWPLAYAPDDGTFDQVRHFVEEGGALLVTGDFRFSSERRPERAERVGALNLPAPKFRPMAPFARGVAELPSTPFAGRLGRGRVLWAPRPLELLEDASGAELYRRFVLGAGVGAIDVKPESASVHVFEGKALEGRYLTAYNAGGEAVLAQIRSVDRLPSVELGLGPAGTGFLVVGNDGRVIAAEAQGVVKVGGKIVVSIEGHAAVLALDGLDLARSREILWLPFGPGTCRLVLQRAPGADRLASEIGELRNGEWFALTRPAVLPAAVPGAGVEVRTDDQTVFDLRLIAAPDRIEAARVAVSRLLNRRGPSR
ncbi:MAG: hypothetical protein GXP31_01170 [Kiritimatiellaeota bacterium]|nr:hypothetical protein [Kiritimatiellota bacterium]